MATIYDPSDDLEIAVYKVFSKFVQQFLSEPIRLLDSGFNAPSGPYTVIKLTDIEAVSGRDGWYTDVDPVTGEQSTYNNFIGYASIYTYGQRAMSRAQQIAYSVRDRNLRKLLSENGIGISETSRVRNASRSINAESMEERAQFSISFNFVQKYTGQNTDGFIEHINSEGTLISDDETILIYPSTSYEVPSVLQTNTYYEFINIDLATIKRWVPL